MNEHYPFVNPQLPYPYDALEPFIDSKTMHLHHDKHLQTYIDNLNAALRDRPMLQCMSLEQLINASARMTDPTGIAVSHNAGGVYNHRLYFDGLTPNPARPMGMPLTDAIDRCFGNMDAFREKFTEAALSVFGSGYAWLVSDGRGRLSIMTTANQETPLPRGLCPVMTIDVWEHAYYLKHYNKRGDYINDWFRVANWEMANSRYMDCTSRICR
jgi:Fe-Mn family superoxide dismutase